jgi:hypothetical protein
MTDPAIPFDPPVATNYNVTGAISLVAAFVALCIWTFLFFVKQGVIGAPWMKLWIVRWYLNLAPLPEPAEDLIKARKDIESQLEKQNKVTSGKAPVKTPPVAGKKLAPVVQPSPVILDDPNDTLPISLEEEEDTNIESDLEDTLESEAEYYISTRHFATMMQVAKSDKSTKVDSGIDPLAGQWLIGLYFKEVQRINEAESHKTATLLRDKHRKLIYMDTSTSTDPFKKVWKCSWCEKAVSLEALFNSTTVAKKLWICENRTEVWADQLGIGKLCHSQTSDPMSLTVLPMAIVDTHKRALKNRIIATYPDIYSLFKRMVIWNDELRESEFYQTRARKQPPNPTSSHSDGSGDDEMEDDGDGLKYNVVTAYFASVFPWANYGDIPWVNKSRQRISLPSRIEELIEYYETASGRKGEVTSKHNISFPGSRWVSQDSIGNTVPLDTYFMPFAVITTDIIV